MSPDESESQVKAEQERQIRLRDAISAAEAEWERGETFLWGPDTMDEIVFESEADAAHGRPFDPDVVGPVPDDRDRQAHTRLREMLKIGMEQSRRNQATVFGPDTMARLRRESEEDRRLGRPINPGVLPDVLPDPDE